MFFLVVTFVGSHFSDKIPLFCLFHFCNHWPIFRFTLFFVQRQSYVLKFFAQLLCALQFLCFKLFGGNIIPTRHSTHFDDRVDVAGTFWKRTACCHG